MNDASTVSSKIAAHIEESEGFTNPYPEVFGYLRIGTPINVDINRPNVLKPALDMAMLNQEGLLLIHTGPTILKSVEGSGFDTKSQNAWGVSSSVSGGYQGSFIDITAEFHFSLQKNISNNAASQFILAQSMQKSGIAFVANPTPTQIYQCGTDDFRTHLDAIIASVNETPIDTTKVFKALSEFYRVYGTGFVSKLELGALGIFQGKAQYSGASDFARFDLGGSLSVGGFVGGAAAAAEFSKQHLVQNAEGHFNGKSFGIPLGSASEQWAGGFLDAFAGAQLQKLSQLDAWSAPFNMNVPSPIAPQLKAREPHVEPLPTIPPGREEDIVGAIRKMQLDSFAEEYKRNNGGISPTPQEYSAYFDILRRVSLSSAQQINLQTVQPIDTIVSTHRGTGVHHGYFGTPKTKDMDICGEAEFGGYTVIGFDYTPWHTVLPFLKGIEEAITGSQVSLGLTMVWLSIRRMMGQYLMYCSRYTVLAPEGTEVAANAYLRALTDIAERIVTERENQNSDWWDPSKVLKKVEAEFRTFLKIRGFDFFNYYEFIIDNYEWLKRVPFGAVPVVPYGNRWYYPKYDYMMQESIQTSPESPAIGPVLIRKDALRFYPIISTDKNGQPYFAWMGIPVPNEQDIGVTGACLTNYPVDVSYDKYQFQVACGMATWREDSGWAGTANRMNNYSDLVHIFPEAPYDRPSWHLMACASGMRPDCLVIHSPSDDPTKQMCLSGVGLEVTLEKAPVGTVQEHKEIILVPIDYETVHAALSDGEPIDHGGVPMWFEPMTDALIEKLHQLND